MNALAILGVSSKDFNLGTHKPSTWEVRGIMDHEEE